MSPKRAPRPGTQGLPPANAHPRREKAGSLTDPDEILASLPLGTPDYIRVLGAILKKHNHEHAAKHKGVSFKTMVDRQRFLAAFFRELRRHTRFTNLDPRQLGGRHVEHMVKRWVERGLATATIHNYLSFLRTYAGWIGRAGMVREPEAYVGPESPHAHRVQSASTDSSWTARNVDIVAKIAEISAYDEWVALQLELCAEFGMRGKEARHFRPHEAVIPREAANPRDADAFPECETFVRLRHGTKGGRPRDIPLATAAQRALLDRVKAKVSSGMYVGRPGYTSQQSQARFYYVIRKFGISKKDLGVVAHGLRHQRVNDAFEEDSGGRSPVRGASGKPPRDEHARNRAARLLGHNRLQVTDCYLGSLTEREELAPSLALASAANDPVVPKPYAP